MANHENINPLTIKALSEKIILDVGGEVLNGLPTIDFTELRSNNEVINRALVLNALFQLSLNAPRAYIANWIENNNLKSVLTKKESAILYSKTELTEQDHIYLYWSLESLWALAWATKLIQTLPFDEEVGDVLANLSPNLQRNEGREKYEHSMQLRSYLEIYKMTDLYYRLHWWLHNAENEGRPTRNILPPVIISRRKSLEWIINRDVMWDDVEISL